MPPQTSAVPVAASRPRTGNATRTGNASWLSAATYEQQLAQQAVAAPTANDEHRASTTLHVTLPPTCAAASWGWGA